MMKKTLGLAVMMLTVGGVVNAATELGTIGVEIENQAITLVNEAGLNFGTVLPFGRDGWISVDPNGSAFPHNVHLSDPSLVSASRWSVTGVPGAPFNVVLPPNNSVSVSNGSETMQVDTFGRSGPSTITMDAAGNASFNVGATLRVGANQPQGAYSGTFEVTVAYN
ncbi:MAG: hypothetical protein Tsb002_10710 [Wenzhouxiangellaceae bacterium]